MERQPSRSRSSPVGPDDPRVDQLVELALDLDDAGLERLAELRRREPDARARRASCRARSSSSSCRYLPKLSTGWPLGGAAGHRGGRWGGRSWPEYSEGLGGRPDPPSAPRPDSGRPPPSPAAVSSTASSALPSASPGCSPRRRRTSRRASSRASAAQVRDSRGELAACVGGRARRLVRERGRPCRRRRRRARRPSRQISRTTGRGLACAIVDELIGPASASRDSRIDGRGSASASQRPGSPVTGASAVPAARRRRLGRVVVQRALVQVNGLRSTGRRSDSARSSGAPRCVASIVARTGRDRRPRSRHSSDSGSTSTDHGASSPPSRSADRIRAAQDEVPAPAVGAPGDVGRAPARRRSTAARRSAARSRSRSAIASASRSAASRSASPTVSLTSRPNGGEPNRSAEGELGVVEGVARRRRPRPGSPGGRAGRSG